MIAEVTSSMRSLLLQPGCEGLFQSALEAARKQMELQTLREGHPPSSDRWMVDNTCPLRSRATR